MLHTINTAKDHGSLEHTQIGDERDLHGRFLNNAINRVQSVLKHITNPENIPDPQPDALRDLSLNSNVNIGSAKIVPVAQRQNYEPDTVSKISGEGENQRVRILGEMKFPRTCEMKKGWDDTESQKRGGMRHVFGRLSSSRVCFLLTRSRADSS